MACVEIIPPIIFEQQQTATIMQKKLSFTLKRVSNGFILNSKDHPDSITVHRNSEDMAEVMIHDLEKFFSQIGKNDQYQLTLEISSPHMPTIPQEDGVKRDDELFV